MQLHYKSSAVLQDIKDTQNSISKSEKSTSSNTNNMVTKPKIKRSRNGCLSCKKMKIKCGEQKPSCEYCAHTGRDCVYPVSKQQLKITKNPKPISSSVPQNGNQIPKQINTEMLLISSSPIQKKLNSPQEHLKITSFQHCLLSNYSSFGEEFFTYHIQQNTHDFWMIDLPRKWSSSQLLKIATFCATSMKLLSKYSLKDIHLISFDNDDNQASEYFNQLIPNKKLNLYEEAFKFFNETFEIVENYTNFLENCINPNDHIELIGQIIVGKTVLYLSCMSISPQLNNEAIETQDISKCGIFKLFDITKGFILFSKKYISYLIGTHYEKMFSLKNEIIDVSIPNKFPFINYLRDYINETIDSLDLLQINFLNIIARMEVDCYRALVFDYPIPLATPLAELSQDEDFLWALKQEHPVAMRIMFYFSSLCSILDNKMFKESSIWDEYIEVYKIKLGGSFQNINDFNVYSCVQARIHNKIPYSLKLLQNFGIKSMEEIMYDSEVVELKTNLSSPYTEVDSLFYG
ncbi:putative transcriptional regulatory protein [Wickerhamomyces ciferrii]|uniref:Transcriptional regulatory protein n=1 Tax=Wickerhamomyces ciferrii (strain ATCC 14091 / BCRC 22168 / CBS 111 / JCM 3599 / NBRC 0793 / NRRL Y-1031 F-60-10) TaxID=1206466 RepID=K0KI36_WICCF|nr:putative transcriptional regulatory protein [Wickerhamomyces ciferrii]CCH42676.1 putative transcriptional regulatory protein [Wickerhamomyces ciferrii]